MGPRKTPVRRTPDLTHILGAFRRSKRAVRGPRNLHTPLSVYYTRITMLAYIKCEGFFFAEVFFDADCLHDIRMISKLCVFNNVFLCLFVGFGRGKQLLRNSIDFVTCFAWSWENLSFPLIELGFCVFFRWINLRVSIRRNLRLIFRGNWNYLLYIIIEICVFEWSERIVVLI